MVGHKYAIRDLLEAMILHTDNDAAALIAKQVNSANFENMFEGLGMKAPEFGDADFQISADEFARILRTLHNGPLFSLDNSEFALNSLTRSAYINDLVKYIPPNVQIAHKFGKRKVMVDTEQFHESGIVYLNDQAYVVCIMTEGKDPS
ncbi:MAG: class A beta-lactamase-related serine hydrolase [Flavobacteriales bacterium]|nr:class A beta-lactamase-related serine hydrolase [Flavobacteriales bacterium]